MTTLSKEAPPSRSIPLGRFAEVDDVADTVLYLLSDPRSKVFFSGGGILPFYQVLACFQPRSLYLPAAAGNSAESGVRLL